MGIVKEFSKSLLCPARHKQKKLYRGAFELGVDAGRGGTLYRSDPPKQRGRHLHAV